MADIVVRDPLQAVRQVMDRFFDEPLARFANGPLGIDEGTLAVDVSEKDGNIVVRSSLPGFKRENIDVQLHDGVLSIKAEHKEEHETTDERFYRRERRFGSVSRRLALPGVVDESAVKAELKDGVLTLTIPVPEKAKPRRIEIAGA
jgi:HSP20 family protein